MHTTVPTLQILALILWNLVRDNVSSSNHLENMLAEL